MELSRAGHETKNCVQREVEQAGIGNQAIGLSRVVHVCLHASIQEQLARADGHTRKTRLAVVNKRHDRILHYFRILDVRRELCFHETVDDLCTIVEACSGSRYLKFTVLFGLWALVFFALS